MRQKAVKLLDWAGTALLGVLIGALGLVAAAGDDVSRHVVELESGSPIILARHATLRSSHGEQVIPMAWSETALSDLAVALDSRGTVSSIAATQGFFRPDGGDYVEATVLNVGRELLSRLAPGARCDPRELLVPNALAAGAERGILEGEQFLVAELKSSLALKALAPNSTGALLLRCAPLASSYPRVAVLPAPGRESDALSAAMAFADSSRDERSFAPLTMHVERLSDAATKELKRTYGWLPALELGFGLTILGVVAGLAFFDATRVRTDFEIRRALGSPVKDLLLQIAHRVGRQVGIATFAGLAILVITVAASDAMNIGFAAHATLLGWVTLGAAAGVSAHTLLTLPGIDRRIVVRSNAAGSLIRSVGAASCLAVMAFILVSFAATSVMLGRHANALEQRSLGYEPTGLYAIRAIPLSPEARGGASVADLLASPLVALGRGRATVVCSAPWELDAFLLQQLYKDAAVTVAAGAGVATVMAFSFDGRDLSATDLNSPSPMLVQANDAQFARDSRVFGDQVGAVHGLLFGALNPRPRNAIVKSLREHPCTAPIVVFRGSAQERGQSEARDLALSLGSRIEAYEFLAPAAVSDELARARRPLTRLQSFSVAGLALSSLCVVLLSALLSFVFVRSRLRQIAIRHALGEPPMRSALGVAKVAALFSFVGGVAGLAGAQLAYTAISRQIPGVEPNPSYLLGSLVALVLAIMTASAVYFAYRYITRTDLVAALRVE